MPTSIARFGLAITIGKRQLHTLPHAFVGVAVMALVNVIVIVYAKNVDHNVKTITKSQVDAFVKGHLEISHPPFSLLSALAYPMVPHTMLVVDRDVAPDGRMRFFMIML